ncbi:MAG: hypothetical protein Kow0099_00690 [Candidatus Abyssubacteria bacterium]
MKCANTGLAFAFAIVMFLTFDVAAGSFDPEIKVLTRALTKALGEETNTGRPRVAEVRCGTVGGEDILVLVLNANDQPLTAALRHGVLSDVTKTARVLKSWEWPLRVERVMIAERLWSSSEEERADQLLFTCIISSRRIREIDWKSFDPARIPDIADSAKFYDIVR